jgi:MBOAT, membrane-bound O-acyltransferase family
LRTAIKVGCAEGVSSPIVRLAIAVAVAYMAALAVYPALGLRRAVRDGLIFVAALVVAASPLVVQASAPFVRFHAALNAIALLLKLCDLRIGAARGAPRPAFGEYVAFLPNIFSLVHRRLDDEPQPERRDDVQRFVVGVIGTPVGGALTAVTWIIDWSPVSFAVEHAAKATLVFLTAMGLSAAGVAAWRLAGGRGLDFMRNPLAARTPAEFWRRYNRPVNQFLYEDVFKPIGGRRAPVRATLAAFALSALCHEYVFGVAIGRVQGYQTAFFLLQGCAVAATLRMRPQGLGAVVGVTATIAFNLASSVLFFASMNEVVAFYWNPLPGWLRW